MEYKDKKVQYVGKKHFSSSLIIKLLSLSNASNQYTNNGPVKRLLEELLHSKLKIKNDKKIVCVSSGTAALQTLFLFLRRRELKRFIIPSYTFPSVVCNSEVVDITILDIDLETYTLPLESTFLENVDGVVLTNLFGTYSNLERWKEITESNKKILIYDNASSPLSEHNGINICNFGDYSFGSLHHTKYLGAGEGGFIVAPSEYYEELNSICNFGFNHNRRVYNPLSSNFKMSDISAAYIYSHIESYDTLEHVAIQNQLISSVNKNILFNYKPGVVYGPFPLIPSAVPHSQEGIEIKKYYKPLLSYPNSVNLYKKMLNFPLYNGLQKSEIETLIKFLRELK
jgi:dTDP-4-amino-4,6-dideoxygalactose transaminase